jgi:acetylornithine deacetylase/succinyl-diaminopimelate desuccinylase-like protein
MRLVVGLVAAVSSFLLSAPAVAQDQPHQRQARAIYERLISFRTAAGHGQVPAMANYIAETLRAGGVPAENIVLLPRAETVAMLVRIPGMDLRARPMPRPILFSAHMDVVDARPEDWERDPFRLIEENGYFFGRGTGDNKAGVASLVSTILRITASGRRPRTTLVFAFIGDEETGMGTTGLVAQHPWVANARFAINSDAGGGRLSADNRPIYYGIQGAEKTFASFHVTIRNPGGHSSRPRPDNAIYQLAQDLLRVREIRWPVMTNAVTLAALGVMARATPPAAGEIIARFVANPDDAQARAVLLANPDFVREVSTTCVATMLEAGHAENALPQRARATVNCRIFPGTTVAEVRETLVAAIADPQATVEVVGDPQPSPISNPDPVVTAAITRSIHARHPGVPITPYQESGGTDGRVYRSAGIPTFASSGIFMRDSDMFFHGLNERIPVAAFYEAIEHIHDLAVDLGGLGR